MWRNVRVMRARPPGRWVMAWVSSVPAPTTGNMAMVEELVGEPGVVTLERAARPLLVQPQVTSAVRLAVTQVLPRVSRIV